MGVHYFWQIFRSELIVPVESVRVILAVNVRKVLEKSRYRRKLSLGILLVSSVSTAKYIFQLSCLFNSH